MKYCVALILIVSSLSCLNAQSNMIGLNVGTLVVEGNVHFHYERTFWTSNQKIKNIAFDVFHGRSVVTGKYRGNNTFTQYSGIGLTTLWFGKRNSLEFGMRGMFATSSSETSSIKGLLPGGHLGYRNTGSDVIFRLGISFPEFIYFGIGIRF